jgi:hypothetical protein
MYEEEVEAASASTNVALGVILDNINDGLVVRRQ